MISLSQHASRDSLETLYRTASHSSSLIASRPARTGEASDGSSLQKFLFLGSRGGGTSMRIGLFAGFKEQEPAGPCAVARFLLEIESWPSRAADYALFCYPFIKPALGGIDPQLWKDSGNSAVQQLERDLRRHFLHGMIEFHSAENLDGVQVYASSRVIAESVLAPLLEKLSSRLKFARTPLIAGESLAFAGVEQLSPPPGITPRPFELRILTPLNDPLESQITAMVAILLRFLADYRAFACHAADL